MKSLYKIFFKTSKTQEEFTKLRKEVKDFRHKLEYELETYEDVNQNKTPECSSNGINEIEFIKNEWVKLPEAFGNGVLSMGMEESDKRKTFLVHYEPNSELFTHKHPYNLERIQVLTGYIKDTINGKVINEGETYLVDKNKPHNIITGNIEAYLFIVFSVEVDTLTINHLIK